MTAAGRRHFDITCPECRTKTEVRGTLRKNFSLLREKAELSRSSLKSSQKCCPVTGAFCSNTYLNLGSFILLLYVSEVLVPENKEI